MDTGFRLGPHHAGPGHRHRKRACRAGWSKGRRPSPWRSPASARTRKSSAQRFVALPRRTRWVGWCASPSSASKYTKRAVGRRIAGLDETLEAPGALANPVPVRALFETEAAHAVALRNLLQRQGFDSLCQRRPRSVALFGRPVARKRIGSSFSGCANAGSRWRRFRRRRAWPLRTFADLASQHVVALPLRQEHSVRVKPILPNH